MVGDILGTGTLDACGANEADMNGDGSVDILDVILIVLIIQGE